jgi:hypothetical protein
MSDLVRKTIEEGAAVLDEDRWLEIERLAASHRILSYLIPPGPWKEEPTIERFNNLGFPSVIWRTWDWTLNGYLGVPSTHPWFGRHDVDARVHGGLTSYSDHCGGQEDDHWYLGFDCSHISDLSPHRLAMYGAMNVLNNGTYKTIEFVRSELHHLAEQALAAWLLKVWREKVIGR